jgi:hypothetical protein
LGKVVIDLLQASYDWLNKRAVRSLS